MSTGRIIVELSSNGRAQPIRNASIVISDSNTNRVVSRQTLTNSESGKTNSVSVDAPDISLSLTEETRVLPYAIYNITITAPGYYDYTVRGVQVFADRVSILEADLLPLPVGTSSGATQIDIPTHSLFSPIAPIDRNQVYDNSPTVLSRVVIPEYITVHLGTPNQSARNVTVRFPDYIKNVCCSEIYSTWPTEALKANIYAQISLALNRIYTEWYRSRGYSFDITNSTAYDQYFVYGRNIEQNISDLVDGMFTMYVRKVGTLNPYYTEYCDGSSVWCPGMKQWGTVTLANNGYTALEILRYYYGTDIEIVEAEIVEGVPSSYPGTPLRVGSSGTSVSTLQRQLARIAQNYPAIGNVVVDGVFGQSTENAVRRFQSIFNLSADGVVGSATWYKISYIYVAVKKLAELSSEGETYGGDGVYPGTPLRLGSTGSSVSSLQYYINVIANAVSFVGALTIDGLFGSATENSVSQIQSLYGLTVDGIVGQTTWNTIYNLYKAIIDNAEITFGTDYPGTPLRVGSTGDDVRLMQNFLISIAGVFPTIPAPAADGIFGSATERSVRAFQTVFGLTADGIIGEQTWDRITEVFTAVTDLAYSGEALRLGSSGTAVRELQEMLNFVGKTYTSIPSLTVDGSFGALTQSAVREFQRIFGLTVDGVVGSATWNALLREYLILLYNPLASDANVYPGTPLRVGSRGENVLRIQSYLNNIGIVYTTVPSLITDGVFGTATERAVSVLQEIFSLTSDGIVGENTWNLIVNLNLALSEYAYGGAALYRGSSGDKVVQLQTFLNGIGRQYPSIPALTVDGNFGSQTEAAVRAFQTQFELNADGIVGRNTWNALLREYFILYFSGGGRDTDYPGTPLSIGSRGDYVRFMQSSLNSISAIFTEIPTLAEDGIFGENTEEAVEIFQDIFGLSQDGIIDEETWDLIVSINGQILADAYGGQLLRLGSRGDEVRRLQELLSALNASYPQIPILATDGIFGERTQSAVITFQQLFNLSPDGIVGEITWNTLLKEYILIMNSQAPISSDVYPGTPLRYGSSGANVVKMKNYLNIIEPYYSTINRNSAGSYFDRQMDSNVRAFQSLFSLSVDGVIGEATWNKIVEIKDAVSADAYAGTLLRYGSSGAQVRKLQERLNLVRNYYSGIPALSEDGIFGYNTQNAVIAYQRAKGLSQDGIVGRNTWNALIGDYYLYYDGTEPRTEPYPGTLLRVGSSGSDVLKMQRYLNIISDVYTSIGRLTPDGIFGSRTRASVQTFQRIFGLSPDGIIGPLTWDKIVSVKNEIEDGTLGSAVEQAPAESTFAELSLGANGESVLEYQRLVNRIANESGELSYVEENGVFGFALQNATKKLQKMLGFAENGRLTKELYETLKTL